MVRAVFIFEGNDLTVMLTTERAASYVEAIDVDRGEFDFFTDDGTVLIGTTSGQRVTLCETDQRRPEELRERIVGYLSHPSVAMDPELAERSHCGGTSDLGRRVG
jgi:hypothetical protein